jgi:hypothetical protein
MNPIECYPRVMLSNVRTVLEHNLLHRCRVHLTPNCLRLKNTSFLCACETPWSDSCPQRIGHNPAVLSLPRRSTYPFFARTRFFYAVRRADVCTNLAAMRIKSSFSPSAFCADVCTGRHSMSALTRKWSADRDHQVRFVPQADMGAAVRYN